MGSQISQSEEKTFPHREAREMAGETFSPFERLPLEIQDAIWTCSMDSVGPRIVELWEVSDATQGFGRVPGWNCQLTSPCPIPSILHTCRRSRWLAKKRWKLSFSFGRGQRNRPKIFFDFTRDTLFFGDKYHNKYHSLLDFEENVNSRDRKSLRRVAFKSSDPFRYNYHLGVAGMARRLNQSFPALTNIILVGSKRVIWGTEFPNAAKRTIIFFPESGSSDPYVRQLVSQTRWQSWKRSQIDAVSYCRVDPNAVQLVEGETWKDFDLRTRKLRDEKHSGSSTFVTGT